LQGINLNKKST